MNTTTLVMGPAAEVLTAHHRALRVPATRDRIEVMDDPALLPPSGIVVRPDWPDQDWIAEFVGATVRQNRQARIVYADRRHASTFDNDLYDRVVRERRAGFPSASVGVAELIAAPDAIRGNRRRQWVISEGQHLPQDLLDVFVTDAVRVRTHIRPMHDLLLKDGTTPWLATAWTNRGSASTFAWNGPVVAMAAF